MKKVKNEWIGIHVFFEWMNEWTESFWRMLKPLCPIHQEHTLLQLHIDSSKSVLGINGCCHLLKLFCARIPCICYQFCSVRICVMYIKHVHGVHNVFEECVIILFCFRLYYNDCRKCDHWISFSKILYSRQGLKCAGMRRYCILALLRKAWDSTGTSVKKTHYSNVEFHNTAWSARNVVS